ncbi:glycerol dehydrogenase [Clostridium novyi A str. 4570]|uniref:Glycerol dehydrogenase n=1 Tax=Clostridium novyi A str. 4570 TaxID=1444290 RepID=A0AA88ZQ96_CLONO|nr:iron-containing alcohol dehydrogenase family protein [Clostridium novyi]KGN02169.1 glycerol dehydrogenase [Clostridium novyi A str. 4570]
MESKNTFLPSYSVGEESYKNIERVCSLYGNNVVLIGGKTALSKAENKIKKSLPKEFNVLETLWYGGEATFENAEMLAQNENVKKADMVFAVGGGKAIDTCKSLCEDLNKPLFTFPTIAGTCAPVSEVSAMYYKDGVFRCARGYDKPPVHCFIDTKIIAEAPDVYLWAGIGDTLAKAYEPEFSSRNSVLDHANAVGVSLSVMCGEPLREYGKKGLEDCKQNKVSRELEETVLGIIVSTGLVSNYLNLDYNSAVAHAMCYGFTTLKQIEQNHLHGEVVSYGVLVQLMLDNKFEIIDKLLPFYKEVGLPTKLADLDVTLDELDGVLEKAVSVPDLNSVAFEVNKENLHKAVLDLEKYNQ